MNYIKHIQVTGENANKEEKQSYNTFSKLYDLFEGDVGNGGKDKLQASSWIYNDSGDQYPTLHYINLGIREMVKPEFTISQNISYAVLNVNGYEYTYTYGNEGDPTVYKPDDTTRPTVKWQSKTDITAYTREIYPSDLPREGVNTSLQIVYKIDITNSTTYDIDGIYKEHKMFVNSLKNEYDASRYTLVEKTKVNETEYQWNKNGEKDTTTSGYNLKEGEAELNLNKTKVFADGIKKGETKTVYIGFDVKKDALTDLLNHPNGIIEDLPTTAIANVYHEYTRYDYGWKQREEDVKKKNSNKNYSRQEFRYWAIDNKDSNGNEVKGQEGKTHHSVPQEGKDSAPYLALKLYTDDKNTPINRTISGTVFKDNNERSEYNEVVGNGKYDDKENKVSKVKVELINKSDGRPAKLYTIEKSEEGVYKQKDTDNDAIVESNNYGEYKFEGVVPGEYYVRFTYGDGNQTICGIDGNSVENMITNKIYSNGYKSTIVSDQKVKSAYNGLTKDGNKSSDKDYLWYLYNTQHIYNTAVDDDINDNSFGYEQQIDFRTENRNEKDVARSKTASTPFISVPIEFTTEVTGSAKEHFSSYDRMSFGIIEKPKIVIEIDKEITNIKLTLQNGQVLISGNPVTQNIPYVANLDEIWSKIGSSYTKIEADIQYMYGSTLELTYSLTAKNNSDVSYTTEDYYKYGIKSNDENDEAKVKVNTLLEYLDPQLKIKYKGDIKEGTGDTEYTYVVNSEINNLSSNTTAPNYPYYLARETLEEKEDVEEGYYNKIYELGNSKDSLDGKELRTSNIAEDDSSVTVKVVAKKILSNSNDNMEYISYAQVSQVTTALNTYSDPTAVPLVNVTGEEDNYWDSIGIKYDKQPQDSAKIIVTPSTGLDRNMKYIVSATIVLISIGCIIVCIKKLKK